MTTNTKVMPTGSFGQCWGSYYSRVVDYYAAKVTQSTSKTTNKLLFLCEIICLNQLGSLILKSEISTTETFGAMQYPALLTASTTHILTRKFPNLLRVVERKIL